MSHDYHMIQARRETVLALQSISKLKQYLSEIEKLLDVLMKSLRAIKEREMIYKGFTRSATVLQVW